MLLEIGRFIVMSVSTLLAVIISAFLLLFAAGAYLRHLERFGVERSASSSYRFGSPAVFMGYTARFCRSGTFFVPGDCSGSANLVQP